jgi:hypothetical protein
MWVKVYDKFLSGSMRRLEPAERSVFIDLLLVAAHSETPGIVQAAPGVPWTDAQLARMLVISKPLLRRACKRLAEVGTISVDDRGLIHVANWSRYQSDSLRVMSYRGQARLRLDDAPKLTREVTPSVTKKVTADVTALERERDLRRSPLSSPPLGSSHVKSAGAAGGHEKGNTHKGKIS